MASAEIANRGGTPPEPVRKPAWLRRPPPSGAASFRVESLIEAERLRTVCREARCPNRGECLAAGTAVFLILGDRCSRGCRFCGVTRGRPGDADPGEPGRVARAAARMGLGHVVVTSVARDDLADGGAGAFAETIRLLRSRSPSASVEVLIPDFGGNEAALGAVIAAGPDVINHNLETVARLYPLARPRALYRRSLELLDRVRRLAPGVAVKSGLMLGLGERPEEIDAALADLAAAGCSLLTVGQYLQPGKDRLPVVRFVPPGEFEQWRRRALAIGFRRVASGPLVRSSYDAKRLIQEGIPP